MSPFPTGRSALSQSNSNSQIHINSHRNSITLDHDEHSMVSMLSETSYRLRTPGKDLTLVNVPSSPLVTPIPPKTKAATVIPIRSSSTGGIVIPKLNLSATKNFEYSRDDCSLINIPTTPLTKTVPPNTKTGAVLPMRSSAGSVCSSDGICTYHGDEISLVNVPTTPLSKTISPNTKTGSVIPMRSNSSVCSNEGKDSFTGDDFTLLNVPTSSFSPPAYPYPRSKGSTVLPSLPSRPGLWLISLSPQMVVIFAFWARMAHV